MQITKKLSIIIPCYNEELRIKYLVEALKEFSTQWDSIEIIVVDDGSTDQSVEIIENDVFLSKLKKLNQFKHIIHEKNQGKGGALRTGILAATGELILTMDTDVSTHPNELYKWLKLLNNEFSSNTIFIGSRTHKESAIKEHPIRKAMGYIFNFFVRAISGIPFRDSQCGFKLYPGTSAKLLFKDLNVYGWAHDVEIICKANVHRINVVEMPVKWNIMENSKVNVFSDSVRMFIQLIKISIHVKTVYKKQIAREYQISK